MNVRKVSSFSAGAVVSRSLKFHGKVRSQVGQGVYFNLTIILYGKKIKQNTALFHRA